MVVGKLDLVQFLFGLFQISKNLFAVRTVFPAQLVDDIQPFFNLLQLIGGVA